MVEIRPTGDQGHRARLVELLTRQSEAAGFPFRIGQVALEAREGQTFLGGLTARSNADWLFVELLAVAPEARGRGIGAALMRAAEGKARAAGLAGMWLDTFAFQAPDFYRRLGFAEFGRIDGHPAGSQRHFFAKRLIGGPSP